MSTKNFKVYLRFESRIFYELFIYDKCHECCLPSGEQIDEYVTAIEQKQLNLEKVWVTTARLKLYL